MLILLSLHLLTVPPYCLSRNCCFASLCIMLNCDLSTEDQASVLSLVWLDLGLSAASGLLSSNKILQILNFFYTFITVIWKHMLV